MTMTQPRINNSDIWNRLNDLDKKLTEIGTNQQWIRESISDIQTTAIKDLKTTTDQIKKLAESANHNVSLLSGRVTKLEQVSWYQKGFWAGIGAVIALAAIVLPNLDKIFG